MAASSNAQLRGSTEEVLVQTAEEQQRQEERQREPLYRAHPLDSTRRQIRVMQIAAATTKEQRDPINATLTVLDLETPTIEYAALSYVWGKDRSEGRTIFCDDIAVNVTSTCHSALWHLRRKLGSFTIWVDAICINQAQGCDEKGWQIKMMTDVYALASAVYIWLGPGSNSSNRAMNYFGSANLRQYIESKEGHRKEHSSRAAWHLINPSSSAYPARFKRRSRASRSDIVQLLDNEWLRRMWTYQEILFANSPIIVCGIKHVKWRRFEDRLLLLTSINVVGMRELSVAWLGLGKAREQLQSDKDSWALSKRQDFMRKVLSKRLQFRVGLCLFSAVLFLIGTALSGARLSSEMAAAARLSGSRQAAANDGLNAAVTTLAVTTCLHVLLILYQLFDYWRQRHESSSAGKVIEGISQRRATEIKDMAYGVWNILRKLNVQNLPEQSYSDDTKLDDLFWKMATALLQTTNDLSLLPLASSLPWTESDAPSWVPNWQMQGQSSLEMNKDLLAVDMEGCRVTSADMIVKLQAKETSKLDFELSQDHRTLSVTARQLGTVYNCGSFSHIAAGFEEADMAKHAANLDMAIELATLLHSLGTTASSLLDQYPGDVKLDSPDRIAWQRVLTTHPAEFLRTSLQKHARGEHVAGWSSDFLTVHVKICNMLAQMEVSICSVRMHGRTHKKITAFCRNKSRDGDVIVRVKGVLQPLLMRMGGAPSASAVLVSTLAFDNRLLDRASSPSNELWPVERLDIH